MKTAEKEFGPFVVEDLSDGSVVEDLRVCVDLRYGYCPIDDMIKALRAAADWLEWRRACERREEG